LRLNAGAAAHAFGAFANNGQADAGSLVLFGRVDPLENVENAIEVGLLNADAAVLEIYVLWKPNEGAAARRRETSLVALP
jgi:hypothetical protein